VVEALKAYNLLVDSMGLDLLDNWHGKVQTDNRLLEDGDIFVCVKGEKFDGHRFIPNAIASGAALIVSMEELEDKHPWILVSDTRKAAAVIAKTVYLPAEMPYKLIGITGTNGKTTTSLILYEALRIMGFKCGWIGTLGYYIDGTTYATHHTTPDIIELNNIFKQMADSQLEYVVMEVSSHALSLDRVFGVEFDYCLFSNLSREHLDFHGTMESYAEAKYLLFDRAAASGATSIVNTADPFGAEICRRLRERQAKCLSLGGDNADFSLEEIRTEIANSSFTLVGKENKMQISSCLIGSFNVSNMGLTALTLCAMGFPVADIESALQSVPPVKGRIQPVENTHDIGVYIDYAHTPDALESLLKSVEQLPHSRIICLFGAGGDRDKGKRPLMLKAALKHSDAVIVTDDNPRFENPDSIVRDIVIDCDPRLPWWIIRDRESAINACIRMAQPGDLVLICGKGHENYQEIEGVRHHFDDYEVAQKALKSWNKHIEKADDELILPVDLTMLEILLLNEPLKMQAVHRPARCFNYISTDSRTVKPGSLFFALVGEHFDGHRFIADVLDVPDNFVIIENNHHSNLMPDSYLKVNNAAQSLGLICQKYLQMFTLKRIALTGSTGKTTCKELIARILNDAQPCLKTLSNENNLIGLCKTILRVLPSHRFAILELGTNHFGEIANLADIACPDIGIILNVGPSHLEFLIDEDGVFQEKSALFMRPLAARLYPGDDPRFTSAFSDGIGIGYSENCQYQISDHHCFPDSQSFTLADHDWTLPYAAPHFAINAAFAIVLASKLGLPYESIQASLMHPINLEMRVQIEPRGSGTLIIDCYNANPCSMQKALEFWQQVQPEKPHVAIIGDMLELGESSTMYHQMIGAMLVDMKYCMLYTVGDMSSHYHIPDAKHESAVSFNSAEELIASKLLESLPDNAVILLKASHGMHLERLIPALRGDV
jgi:UDP-N-acetylmuramyl-tripeptide synthetase/UDP-N-acetylmuramoyl-tripeptide--D-alanyl-D-alanine ligase